MNIKGKTIFITGGASGIGIETAKKFLKEEANVVIYSRGAESMVDAEILKYRDMGRVMLVEGDICDKWKVKNAMEKTIEKFGSLDVVINNAGIAKKQSFVDSMESDWDAMVNVNLKGTFMVSQEAMKMLIKLNESKKNDRMIINISSGAGLFGVKDLAVYSATKAGVISFTQAINLELKDFGIEAITVTPGSVDTKMFKELFPDQKPHHSPVQVANVIYEVAIGEIKPDNRMIVDVFYHTR